MRSRSWGGGAGSLTGRMVPAAVVSMGKNRGASQAAASTPL